MARRSVGTVLLGLFCLWLAAMPAQAADDAEQVAAAKKMAADISAARKGKDVAALEAHIKKAPGVHNAIANKPARGKLQKELGALVKAKGLDSVSGPAITALTELNDKKGAFKQLKRHLPGPKDKVGTDLGKAALGAVGEMAADAAIGVLLELGEKAKDYDVGALAITGLGRYKASKKRVMILESLVKLISRFQPPRGVQIGVEAAKRWKALGLPLVVACNTLTGRKETSSDAWLELWKGNKKKPGDLFAD
jgi:hypothetical protein